jgi:hypothetical protein
MNAMSFEINICADDRKQDGSNSKAAFNAVDMGDTVHIVVSTMSRSIDALTVWSNICVDGTDVFDRENMRAIWSGKQSGPSAQTSANVVGSGKFKCQTTAATVCITFQAQRAGVDSEDCWLMCH